MKDISISARTVSGVVGLVTCYAISIYFFWLSQISLSDFHIDPSHSRVVKALYPILGRDDAKPVGIVLAFLSIHASWAWRHAASNLWVYLYQKVKPAQAIVKDITIKDVPASDNQTAKIESDAQFQIETKIENTHKEMK